ncbi:putative pectate lyase E [Bisporella sp. PMI_857]|nr:putative pectate lyase E [Bisporella sp. PMI_857]
MQFSTTFLLAVASSLAAAQTLNIPTRVGSIVSLSSPSSIVGTVDLGNKEFDRGRACDSDDDTGSSNAVFIVKPGGTLKNVIIGANALEGVHCEGACTLVNVWFRDVCEGQYLPIGTGTVLIQGGGAQNAKDKVVQANGRGTTTIKDYTVVNVGKLYRSCGNCSNNGGPRNVIVTGLKANSVTSAVVGINSNYGDVSTISGSCGKSIKKTCQQFTGIEKNGSAESPKVSSTANCKGTQGTSIPAC